MSERQISLPDTIYQGLLAAAHASGVTLADWIANHLPKPIDAFEEFDPSTVDHRIEALVEKMTKQERTNKPTQKRLLGRDKGLFTVPDDFNAPLPEDIQAAFEGRT
jgi:hypothetical protein